MLKALKASMFLLSRFESFGKRSNYREQMRPIRVKKDKMLLKNVKVIIAPKTSTSCKHVNVHLQSRLSNYFVGSAILNCDGM